MKTCGRCGQVKSIEEFSWRRKAINQRHNYCRPCHSAYRREHYLANRQRYIDRAKKRATSVAEERAIYLLGYFREHPCADCGESDPVVLEFDHLRDKAFNISKGLRDRSLQSVLDEIAKCDVVCANCHRRRTARRHGHVRALVAQR